MSESYNSDKNKITIFDVLLMFISLFVALPILPFVIIYIFLILKTNKRENYFIVVGIAVCVIFCSKLSLFAEQATAITVTLIKSIFYGTFAIKAYGQYSFSSWILLVAVSLVIASYAVKRIRYNYKLEEVGVVSLQR